MKPEGPSFEERRAADELDEEIRHHIDERTDHLVALGWSRRAAREEAERRFGDAARIRGELRELHRPRLTERLLEAVYSVAGDVRYAVRALLAAPAFSLATCSTLAVGIGAAAAVFSVADALLLRPLQYEDRERWVTVSGARPDGGWARMDVARLQAWREAGSDVFEAWIAWEPESMTRTDVPVAELVSTVVVTPGAERLLGIPLVRGRGFTRDDAEPGATPVALIGEEYWKSRGRDPEIVGSTLRLESGPVTVVGIVGSGVKFPPYGSLPDLWLPIREDFTFADRAMESAYAVWALLARGATPESAGRRAEDIAAALQQQRPREEGWRVRVRPLNPFRGNPETRAGIAALAGTVAALLIISFVNGVNLLVARATGRWREVSVRVALGASSWRMTRQFLLEGVVLGGGAAVAAVLLVCGAVPLLGRLLPDEFLYFAPHAIEVEGRTLAFVFVISLAAGVVLGLLPAAQLPRHGGTAPGVAGPRGGDTPARRRIRGGLVVTQVALSVVLIAVAGLLANGFVRLLDEDPGFDYERMALADLELSPTRYPDPAARAEFARRLDAALEARPEIASVSITSGTALSFGALQAEGSEPMADRPESVPHERVRPDYFRTFGTRLTAGRELLDSDAGTDNVVVDRDLATLLWGRGDPLGRRFRVGEDGEWRTVVGVVEELRLAGRDQRSEAYQFLEAIDPSAVRGFQHVGIRARGAPEAVLPAFEAVLAQVDPDQAYWRLRTGARALAEEEGLPRLLLALVGALSTVAVLLAAVGLYGVMAYSVGRRRPELGVRMALGAGRGRVQRMVLREGMLLAGAGVALGLLGAVQAGGLMERLLYEVSPNDVGTLAITTALLLGVAALAAYLPARDATRVDPMEVLRSE